MPEVAADGDVGPMVTAALPPPGQWRPCTSCAVSPARLCSRQQERPPVTRRTRFRLRGIGLDPVAVTADGELVVLDAAMYTNDDKE